MNPRKGFNIVLIVFYLKEINEFLFKLLLIFISPTICICAFCGQNNMWICRMNRKPLVRVGLALACLAGILGLGHTVLSSELPPQQAATVAIQSPSSGALLPEAQVTVDFAVTNFAIGPYGTPHIIFREIVPNMMSYIIISFTLAMTGAIYALVGLVLLGLAPYSGVNWGVMLSLAYNRGALYFSDSIWYIMSPVVAIAILQLSLITMNRSLELIFNPRLRTEA